MKINYFLTMCVSLMLLTMSTQSNATPAFARATSLTCSACHSAFPSLNALGRSYKTRGYRLNDASENSKKSDFTKDISKFPIAAAIISRPYVKDSPGNTEIRAIHELEIFTGGVFYRNLSGFFEIESEGEDGFGNVLGLAALNYDFNDAFHIQVANAQTFFADPYDTLSSGRRLTAAHYNVLNDTFGAADNGEKLRHSRQQVSLFGRIVNDKLFYNIGIGGLTEDKVANKSTAIFGRLAYDIAPAIMIGTFGVNGSCDTSMTSSFANCAGSTTNRDFSRYGLDTQIDISSFRLTGVYMQTTDDLVSSTKSENNDDYYLQAVYFGRSGENQFVPLIRYQSSESNDGKDKTKRYIVGVTYYVYENFKTSIEYSDDTSVPASAIKTSNTTIQLMVAF
ncbi:MAG: hypothetical protein BMS9Abin31_1288 [Gammaproteobacteria bacterium]|nr:MAG: hypothetical protein BMS9Abin31_1288 [Gammaproteobacteria bacterium]